MSDDYDVGYKRPPKHARFEKGQSGNPKGRPKGTMNLKTDLAEELGELIVVREGGTQKTISKQKAMLKSLAAKAIQGDTRASALLIDMIYRLLHEDESEDRTPKLGQEDVKIIENFESRIRSSNLPATTPAGLSESESPPKEDETDGESS